MSSVPSIIRKFTTEEFLNDLPEKLNEKEFLKAAKILNDAGFPLKKHTQSEIVALLKDQISESTLSSVKEVLSSLSFFCQAADDYSELDKFISEAVSGIENKKIKDLIKKFFNTLESLKNYYSFRRLESYKTRANRYFIGLQYACELKARFVDDFSYKETPIENFVPELYDTVPLISVSFKISDGENKEKVIFQVEEDELDEIITTLFAAQKEMKILKEKLKG